ncbi:tape measure protein [Gallibacterium anatis]|uniref:tape measure protein n=1 Tax=Gallibacterium anatis TaxID=750 RepID=UPI0030066E85
MNKLQIQVLLGAVDKMTAPLRSVESQTRKFSQALSENKEKLKALEKVRNQIDSFGRMKSNIEQSTKSIQKYSEKIASLQGKHEKLKSGRDNLIVNIKDKKRELQQLINAQNALRSAGKSNSNEFSVLNAQVMKANHTIFRMEEQLQKQKNALGASKRAINAEKIALKASRHEKAKQLVELRRLRQKLKESGIDVKRLGTNEIITKNKIRETTKEIEKQRKALERLNKVKLANERYKNRIQFLKAGSEQFASLGQRAMVHGAAILGVGYGAGRGVIGMAKTAAQFEQFQTVLETTEGSKEKAQKSMDWISDFATKTPYELNEVTESFVRLRAYGMDPTNGLLKTLGDTSSAMGKPIMQAVEAIADAITGENERLKEFGIKGSAIRGTNFIQYEYTDRYGKQRTAKVDKNNRKQIEETLKKIWNEKYADAMDKQSKTLIGIWSNLQDQWVRFQNMVMQSKAFDVLKNKLQNVLDAVNKMADSGELAKWANDIGQAISTVVEGLWEAIVIIAKTAKQLGQWIVQNKDLAVSIIKWGVALGGVLTGMGLLSLVFSYTLYPVARLALGFAHLIKKSFDFVGSLKEVDTGLLKTNKHLSSVKGWKNVGESVSSTFKNISTGIKTHIIAIILNFKLLGGKVKKLSFWINSVKNLFKFAFAPLRFLLAPIVSAISFLLSPIGLLVAALVGAGVVIYRNWEKVRAFFGGFWEGLKSGLAPVIEKFKPLGDLFGVVVGWVEKAVKWFTDLLSPVQSTSKDLDSAAAAGKKFGEWLAKGIDLATKPLQLLMDGIQWVIDNMPSINENTEAKQEELQKGVRQFHGGANILMDTAGRDVLTPKWSGGYAGNGGKYQPKGIFHGGEYIMTKEATSRLGVPLLNALNYGKNAMLAAGLGVSVASAQPIKVDNRPPLSAKPQTTQTASQPMQVTININAQQGQSAVDIAKEVEKALRNLESQKQARARSALRDRD